MGQDEPKMVDGFRRLNGWREVLQRFHDHQAMTIQCTLMFFPNSDLILSGEDFLRQKAKSFTFWNLGILTHSLQGYGPTQNSPTVC